MDYINPARRSLRASLQELPSLFQKGIISQEKEIRELIRDRWKLGIKPDGSIIGIYHSKGYAFEKSQKNPLAGFGHVDLIETGALWKGIKISPFGEAVEVYSVDSKYIDISKKYGDANFNLTNAERDTVVNIVSATIMNNILTKAYA